MNRPVALVCHICGREFGTKSLAIHVKACQKKWEDQENLKAAKDRRPCPQPPKAMNAPNGAPMSKQEMIEFNAGAMNKFVEEALVQCEYCGRRFNEKSLVPHQKACMKSPMIKKPYVSSHARKEDAPTDDPIAYQAVGGAKGYSLPPDATGGQNMQLKDCRKCGRSFAVDRLQKHEKVCKGPQKKAPPKYDPIVAAQQENRPVVGSKAPGKKPKWQAQHEQFQAAMKNMKKIKDYEAKGGKLSDLPPPPPSDYSHYVECRYCGRKFAEQTAERHIPKCANIINKPGGIKPSTIGDKYIAGTGASSNKQPARPSMNIAPTPVQPPAHRQSGSLVIGNSMPRSGANVSMGASSGSSAIKPSASRTSTTKIDPRNSLNGMGIVGPKQVVYGVKEQLPSYPSAMKPKVGPVRR